MRESELLTKIRELADERELLLFHCHDSRRAIGTGFPDIVVAGPNGTFFAELKDNLTTLTPDQRRWSSVLRRGGEKWFVFRPRDLQSGVIEKTLDEISELT